MSSAPVSSLSLSHLPPKHLTSCVSPLDDPSRHKTIKEPSLTFEHLYTPARRDEQQCHFDAISNAMKRWKKSHPLISLANATAAITTETIAKEKLNRHYHLVCRLGALDSTFPQEKLYETAKKASSSRQNIEELCASLGIGLLPASHHLISSFREQEQRITALETPSTLIAARESLTASIASLDHLLSYPPLEADDLEDRNRSILNILRKIYSSPLYKALCTSDAPIIDFLHSIAIEQYTNTLLAPTFERLGNLLQKKELSLPQRISTLWNRLKKIRIDNGIFTTLFHYSFRLLITIGIPYLALKIAQIFSLTWLIPYIGDERSILGNTPGALTDEYQWKDSLHRRTIRTVVFSAPTLGEEASPEFQAALQTLENNQLSSTGNPYLTWAYTNLQNISFTPEHISTITLMKLHNFYPLSFQTITLPQNLPESPTSTFSHDDVVHHLSLLFQKRSSSLEDRGRNADAGYYIPHHFLNTYQPAIEEIANDAYLRIDKNRGSHNPEFLKKAFTKLFHLGLTRLHETVSFNLAQMRSHRTALSAIRSTICASCIDRGGMMNAATIHALDADGSLNDLGTGTYLGRAILTHRRSPMKQTVDSLSTLFAVIPAAETREFLTRITPGFSSSLGAAT